MTTETTTTEPEQTTANGQPVKRPSMLGNANALVHGARSSRRHMFTLPKATPEVPGDETAHGAAYAVRRQLETELGEIRDTLTTQQQSAINTAARIEFHIKSLDHWINREKPTGKARLEASAQVIEFAERRDRAIERLSVAGKQSENGLPALPQSALDELDDEEQNATGDESEAEKRIHQDGEIDE